MNCPKCGKERVSDETSFCSGCGLYLDFLKAVMENEGYPQGGFETDSSGTWLNRKNLRLSALLWFVAVTAFLLPISAIMGGPSKMLAVLGLMGPVGAAFLLVISMFFPSGEGSGGRAAPKKSVKGESRKSLPADRTVFAEDFVAPSKAAPPSSVERPPSVTEETTRHLDEKVKAGS